MRISYLRRSLWLWSVGTDDFLLFFVVGLLIVTKRIYFCVECLSVFEVSTVF